MSNKRETARIVSGSINGEFLEPRKASHILASLWTDGGEGTAPVAPTEDTPQNQPNQKEEKQNDTKN